MSETRSTASDSDSDAGSDAGTGRREPAGGIRIASRALTRVAERVAAEEFGVGVSVVSADLTDDAGSLALGIRAGIRVPTLARVRSDEMVVDRSGGTVLDRAGEARERIRGRVGELTGYRIGRVDVRLTKIDVRPEERVR